MSDKPISDLRPHDRGHEHPDLQREYIRHIEAFASSLGHSPDTATGDDVRRFRFVQVDTFGAQRPNPHGTSLWKHAGDDGKHVRAG